MTDVVQHHPEIGTYQVSAYTCNIAELINTNKSIFYFKNFVYIDEGTVYTVPTQNQLSQMYPELNEQPSNSQSSQNKPPSYYAVGAGYLNN